MTAVYAVAVGLLFTIGCYQLLGRDLLRIAFGIYMAFNGVNLLIMALGTVPTGAAPFAQLRGPYVDPLVQAMVLTAIVIGFGLATFLLILAARLAQARNTLDAEAMRRWRR
ncbi:MAG TPA: sodium:proton antiporter [Pantanalinema sp.]